MRPVPSFRVLVTGPCSTGAASLLQSVVDGPLLATDLMGDVPGARPIELSAPTPTVVGIGCVVPCDDRVDAVGTSVPRLVMIATSGAERGSVLTDAVKHEVDAAIFLVDASAPHTHSVARVMLRSLVDGLHVPLVVAIDQCDDPSDARAVALSMGAPAGARMVPCQLIDPRSSRDVVLEALEALLASMASPGGDRLLT